MAQFDNFGSKIVWGNPTLLSKTPRSISFSYRFLNKKSKWRKKRILDQFWHLKNVKILNRTLPISYYTIALYLPDIKPHKCYVIYSHFKIILVDIDYVLLT